MDPNSNQPKEPNPPMPQPLNTSGPVSQDGAGVPPPSVGLPSQLPGNPEIKQSSGGKKMMIIIISILVLAILGVGGYYFYMQYSQKNKQPVPETNQTDQDLVNLQTETEKIELTDPSGDLSEVDSEINLLEATAAGGIDR